MGTRVPGDKRKLTDKRDVRPFDIASCQAHRDKPRGMQRWLLLILYIPNSSKALIYQITIADIHHCMASFQYKITLNCKLKERLRYFPRVCPNACKPNFQIPYLQTSFISHKLQPPFAIRFEHPINH